MKINVIGCSGSGKSTFSHALASLFSVPYIELDALFWQQNWQPSSDEQLNDKLSAALKVASTGWVLDGNYTRTQPIKWQDADFVIWLDYSFIRTLYQNVRRTVSRIFNQKELWPNTGNYETWRKAFFSKDSIILWMLQTYHQGKDRRISSMADEQYKHIHFIRITTPKEADFFLELMRKKLQHADCNS
ncbi:adenylate kinase family enzyme [Providencia alcalifaciens]|nr:adenylate kinase family enzyme [Providencia alcalifaciens]